MQQLDHTYRRLWLSHTPKNRTVPIILRSPPFVKGILRKAAEIRLFYGNLQEIRHISQIVDKHASNFLLQTGENSVKIDWHLENGVL